MNRAEKMERLNLLADNTINEAKYRGLKLSKRVSRDFVYLYIDSFKSYNAISLRFDNIIKLGKEHLDSTPDSIVTQFIADLEYYINSNIRRYETAVNNYIDLKNELRNLVKEKE